MKTLRADEKALVLGLGVSGDAAARLLAANGSDVTIVDRADTDCVRKRAESLGGLGVRCLTGASELPQEQFDLCVVSPGVDSKSKWAMDLTHAGVEIISELELGYRYCDLPLVAVTGTNGKSTLVKLIHDTLEAAGMRSAIAGNYGRPLCDVVMSETNCDWLVVEVSSFQLELVSRFRPKVGVLLNIQPDHLDRHGDVDCYRMLKSRLFAQMESGDKAIVHEDEFEAVSALVCVNSDWLTFGLSKENDACFDKGRVIIKDGDKELCADIAATQFSNSVMGQTACAAALATRACGADLTALTEVLKSFIPLPHRMEFVAEIDDVFFVDDSKATNLAALAAGIRMVDGRIRLIAGGQLKEKDLSFVKEVLATRVASVYVIGEATEVMKAAWSDTVPCIECNDLKTATRAAWEDSDPGDCVLLSPGCASFDQFASYKDRGDQFVKIVEDINEERRHENIVSG